MTGPAPRVISSPDGPVLKQHTCRSLATPQDACHFVSLIEARLEWDTDVWNGQIRHFWASLHTILSAGLATAVSPPRCIPPCSGELELCALGR